MPIPLACGHNEYEGQRVTSWGQPATQTNRDPNRDKKFCDSTSNGTDQSMSERFTKPSYSISRAISIDSDFCRLLTRGQRSQQQSGYITLHSGLINKSKFLETTQRTEIREIEMPRSMVVVEGGLELVRPAREPASSRPKPCAYIPKKAPRILPVRRSL